MISVDEYYPMGEPYATCNLCHQPVPEISKETEPPYRFHPACRPEVVAKREAAKEARRVSRDNHDLEDNGEGGK